jgi:hypothetical protein
MSNDRLAIVPVGAIESVLEGKTTLAIKDLPPLQQALALAAGVHQLRNLISKEVTEALLLPLQNSPLGFLTDNKGGYDGPTVRECAIEAMLRGLRVTGNEFNIISGRMYPARAGLERLVGEFPGLTDLELTPGVPHTIADKGALVPFQATWLLNGKSQSMSCEYNEATKRDSRIPVKVNSGMGPDAILGKATRKMCARILQRLTGSVWTDGEVGEQAAPLSLPMTAPDHATEGKRMSLGKASQTPAEPQRQPGDD